MSHLARKHRDVDIDSISVHTMLTSLPQDDNSLSLDSPNADAGEEEMIIEQEQALVPMPKPSLERSVALFLLTLKEKYQLTQAALDFTISQVKEMMYLDSTEREVDFQAILENAGIEVDLSLVLPYKNPFSKLETEYLQTKYFKDHFGLVVSIFSVLKILLYCLSHTGAYFNRARQEDDMRSWR